jgi:hypothetical protein
MDAQRNRKISLPKLNIPKLDIGKAPSFIPIASPATPDPNSGTQMTLITPPVGSQWSGKLLLGSELAVSRLPDNNLRDAIVVRFINPSALTSDKEYKFVFEHVLNDNHTGVDQMREAIEEIVKIILQLLRSGATVIVHCHAGISRSVTFVLALLQQHAFDCGIAYDASNYGQNHIKHLRIDPANRNHHINQTELKLEFSSLLYDIYLNLMIHHPSAIFLPEYPLVPRFHSFSSQSLL